MDYRQIYEDLCERGRNRCLLFYKETHHILPRCMGGNDDPKNLVDLTPEEHYLAHQLLVKIYPENKKLAYALQAMCASSGNQIRNNKMYGWVREAVNEARKNFKHSDETKKKMSLTRKGRVQTPEWIQKRTDANIGRTGPNLGKKFSEEHRQKISKSHQGKVISEETRNKLRMANLGKKHTEETKQKMRNARAKKNDSETNHN